MKKFQLHYGKWRTPCSGGTRYICVTLKSSAHYVHFFLSRPCRPIVEDANLSFFSAATGFSIQDKKTTSEKQPLPSGLTNLNAIHSVNTQRNVLREKNSHQFLQWQQPHLSGYQCSAEARCALRFALSRLEHLALLLLLSPMLSLLPAARTTQHGSKWSSKCSPGTL